MAIQSALTGHLVLSTLHTNDAPTVVTRLLDLGVPAYLLNSTLLGVMAQRLVRTLCLHCKEKSRLIIPKKSRSGTTLFRRGRAIHPRTFTNRSVAWNAAIPVIWAASVFMKSCS